MELKDFENKNLIFESIWKTIALTVISGLFVLLTLIAEMQKSDPFIFWAMIGIFGFGLVFGLSRLLNPKNVFLKPEGQRAQEYRKLDIERRLNDNGIFEFNRNGFRVELDKNTKEYNWNEVLALFGYKKDLYSIDCICVDVFTKDGKVFSVNEDTPGWYQFLKQSKMNLNGIPPNWEIEIAVPAFETKLTLLYDFENRDLEEALDKYYNSD